MSSNAWKLTELKFPRPDLQSFEDLHKDAIERVKHATDGEDVLEVIFEVDELSRRANDLRELTFIRHTMDITDEKYESDARWVDQNDPLFSKAKVDFSEALYSSPYKEFIDEKLGVMYFAKMDVKKKIFCEENIPLHQRESVLEDEFQKILTDSKIEFMGETKNFLQIQRLFTHEDREVRKGAFKAFSDFLKANEERFEEIWDELIKVRNEMGRNLGFENYLPVGYLNRGRLDYGEEQVKQFRKQVEEVIVPICTRLCEAQAKRLGIDEIKAYDEKIIFPGGNGTPLGDKEFMMDKLIEMFRDLSPETEEFINFMLDHELIDYEERPGKANREYASLITSRKAPFVFSHFTGDAASMRNILGSLGHAFASYRSSRRQPVNEYYWSSADIMEIHVMAMQQFSNKYAEEFFGEDKTKYEFSNLQDLMTFIPFGVAVDEFQHICYKNPELTPKERTAEWRKLEKKYMPWRKYDEEDEFMERGGYWYHKHHIILYPLYYIEYALSTVNAMEMYKSYVERPESAWKEYLSLADLGGSKPYLEILDIAGLTPAYEEGAVEKATSYVKEVLEKEINI